MSAVRVAIAQINACVGDLAGNADKVLQAARQAHARGADVLLAPELVLTGYPPEDLLLRPAFLAAAAAELATLTAALAPLSGLSVVLGHPLSEGGRLYNAASVLRDGQVVGVYRKQELPNYAVFDEIRYFSPGAQALVFEVNGVRLGVNICEDVWLPRTAAQAAAAGAQVLLVPNGSPFDLRQHQARRAAIRRHAVAAGLPVLYANLVGGQDELVFDGESFVMDRAGNEVLRLPGFEPALAMVDLDAQGNPVVDAPQPAPAEDTASLAQVWQALVLGTRDYLSKNGFKGAVIGLSGGIDSAVVLALAVDALGASQVRTLMMPSRYTADISLDDAQDMADRLGVRHETVAIAPMVEAFEQSLAPQFAGLPIDATEENIQARVRGTLLMALSNKSGWLVLTTGNKSELTTGYCTLYGDMAGGYAPIKDVPKTLVYALARWRNSVAPVIPERIITRPPSAELRPDQTDQDSLPDYEVLDAILQHYMEDNGDAAALVARGHDPQDVALVLRLLRINEYKRRQAAPGPRITPRAFGRDWRYPITNGFREPV